MFNLLRYDLDYSCVSQLLVESFLRINARFLRRSGTYNGRAIKL